jgi:hypothetical protein
MDSTHPCLVALALAAVLHRPKHTYWQQAQSIMILLEHHSSLATQPVICAVNHKSLRVLGNRHGVGYSRCKHVVQCRHGSARWYVSVRFKFMVYTLVYVAMSHIPWFILRYDRWYIPRGIP